MFSDIIKSTSSFNKIFDAIRSGKNTSAFGVCQNEKAFITCGLDEFVVYVTSDFIQAQEMVKQLNSIKGGFVFLPAKDEVLLSKKGTSVMNNALRNKALYDMNSLNGIVVTVDSLCQRFPNKQSFFENVLLLKKNDNRDVFKLVSKLVEMGYKQSDEISSCGQFKRKGDILDVFCAGHDNPVRIEFFGDTIEDIRNFDKLTNKSIEKKNDVAIIPINQFFSSDFNSDELKEKVFASIKKQKLEPNNLVRLRTVAEDVFVDIDNKSFDNLWLLPFIKSSTLADFLPQNAIVAHDEPKQLSDKLTRIYEEHFQRMAYLLEKGEVLPESVGQLIPRNVAPHLFEEHTHLGFQGIGATNNLFAIKELVTLKSSPVVNYKNRINILCDDLKNWITNKYIVALFADEKDSALRLQSEIEHNGLSVGVTDEANLDEKGINISCEGILHGFVNHDDKIVYVGSEDIFPKIQSKQKVKKNSDKIFTTPDIGDYVVHDTHGIGLCDGIVSLSGSFGTKDFIVVKYKNDDTLYVPVESSNLLTKYSGSERAPRVSKLGGNDFEKIKAKVKANLKEMAFDLLKLYATRENARGFSYPKDEFLEEEFAKSFPYHETVDQLKCIEAVYSDLEGVKIMDRLICGDVGYGKTEVALRAAFKVISSGRQVAFLSPTTILAEQHFKTCVSRFSDFGVDVECLNRFRSAKEQKEILQKAEQGKADLICGTHRLLSKDVRFADLGLLILDEEQQFGVEAKETIKNIKTNIDVLTLSATPIPRTLHMALTGMRDISVIQTPPKDRLPVETYVLEGSDTLLADVILREVNRGGQVFLIYNRVETIDRFAFHLEQLMPNVRFIVAHGQMNETVLEKNIYDFGKGDYDVLVSSTIIENGIDIPNANTLIVYDSDNFGLSQLYQLRGRVGRSNRRAFAYFMYRENKVLTDIAYKRLNSVLEYTELGSGFKIAMRDLEIRGAGNVLGREQHGHMEKVGYDMYCKLLTESVDELRGVRTAAKIETVVEVAIDATASKYIEDSDSRMAFYQRLASVGSEADAEELQAEITDIYGTPPKEVMNLLYLAILKAKAGKVGISEVIVRKDLVCISFENKEFYTSECVFAALEKFKNSTKMKATNKLSIVFDCGKESMEKAFDKVCEFVDTALSNLH